MKILSKSRKEYWFIKSLVVLCTYSVIFILPFVGCSQNDLSRSKAGKIIIEHKKFPILITDAILLEGPNFFLTEAYKRVQQEGAIKIISYIKNRKTGMGFGNAGTINTEITEKGKKYLIGQPFKSKSGPFKKAKVKCCERVFLKVTGIVFFEFGGKGADVKYEWTVKNKTPFGHIARFSACKDPGKVRTSSVIFGLYDDGWRIEE